jgi:hypothetical protein
MTQAFRHNVPCLSSDLLPEGHLINPGGNDNLQGGVSGERDSASGD